MLEILSVVKKIVFTLIFVVLCNSTYAHAKTTAEILYEAERDFSPTGYLPKKFYIGLGLKAPSFTSNSFDTTLILTEDVRKLLHKLNNLSKMLGQKSVDVNTTLPSSLDYSPGFGLNLTLGYNTNKFGSFELEGAFNRVFVSQLEHLLNHDSAALTLNWQGDLLRSGKFSLIGGGGIGGNWSWISAQMGLPISNFINSLMIKAKTGVKWQLTESVDLIASYEFSLLSITENFIIKSKIINLLETPEKAAKKHEFIYIAANTVLRTIFDSHNLGEIDELFKIDAKQAKAAQYLPHGPKFEIRIKF